MTNHISFFILFTENKNKRSGIQFKLGNWRNLIWNLTQIWYFEMEQIRQELLLNVYKSNIQCEFTWYEQDSIGEFYKQPHTHIHTYIWQWYYKFRRENSISIFQFNCINSKYHTTTIDDGTMSSENVWQNNKPERRSFFLFISQYISFTIIPFISLSI